MSIPCIIQIILIAITFFLMLLTILYARTSAPQKYLSVAMICSFIGICGYYEELTARSMSDAYRACKLEYIAYIISPLMVLYFISLYDNTRINLIIRRILLVSDTIVLCAVLTCERNSIYYKSLKIVRSGNTSYILVSPGPLYYFNIFVMILWAVTAFTVSLRVYRKNRNRGTKEYLYLFLSVIFFVTGWIVAKMHIFGYYDLSALDCVLSLFFLTYVTFRYGLFDTVAEAKENYINGMEEGILVTNPAGRLIFANPEMKYIFDKTDWNNQIDIKTTVIDFLNTNENGFLNRNHYYSWRQNDTHDNHGKFAGKVYYLFDISDTYNYTKQLLELKVTAVRANQIKNIFISNVSHEIRTPINSILGMNEMISRENTIPEVAEYSYNIREAGKNLLVLANDILDMSRMEAGKIEIRNSKYDIAVLINVCLQMVTERINERGLLFDVSVSNQIPTYLVGDEIRIKQCITNFLTNAIKYTDKGYVSLNVDGLNRSEDVYILCISVTDTGRGIREEDIKNLFNPFVRIDAEKNRNIEGAGLGLSLTKQMVDLMHGEIRVNSIYGTGSNFSVEIPQVIADPESVGDFKAHLDKVKRHNEDETRKYIAPQARILVVDDNSVNREVAKGLMKPLNMHVDEACSGFECLKMMDEKQYHIVFMDHMMPEMNGIQTLHEIHRLPASVWKRTAIIALTANASSDAKSTYMREGFTDYMMKPIEISLLYKMIEYYLPKDMIKYL